jgi:hypothetical protein
MRPDSVARAGLAAAATYVLISGCVSVPPEVAAEFADDDGARPHHFRLRPEAERAPAERAAFERAARMTPDPRAATPTARPREG